MNGSAQDRAGRAESARKWCGLIRANKGRLTPRAEVLNAILRYLPLPEVSRLTGLSVEQIEKYREGAK